jgi:predicted anti-sigma-YlaC factor YlaD
LVTLVTDYLEGALPHEQQVRFEAHLHACTNCQAYLDQMRETIRLLGMLPEETIQPAAREELLMLFRAWKSA